MACWHSVTSLVAAVMALTLISCAGAAPIGLVDLDSLTQVLLQPSSQIYFHASVDQYVGPDDKKSHPFLKSYILQTEKEQEEEEPKDQGQVHGKESAEHKHEPHEKHDHHEDSQDDGDDDNNEDNEDEDPHNYYSLD